MTVVTVPVTRANPPPQWVYPAGTTHRATEVWAMASPDGVEVHGPARDRYPDVLSDEALGLVAELQRELGPTREALLARRGERQSSFDAGELPDFLPETASVREGDWRGEAGEGLAHPRGGE